MIARQLLPALVLLGMTFSTGWADDEVEIYQQFVKYQNESVWLGFTNLRATEAAYLMRSTTGVVITLPASADAKTVSLTLEETRVDSAVRALLLALDLDNSFLVYDGDGHLTDVIALERAAGAVSTEAEDVEEDSIDDQ